MAAETNRPLAIGFAAVWACLVAAALCSPSLVSVADPSDFITRRTADVAVLFWWLSAVFLLTGRRNLGRLNWLLACAAYVVHVAAAFHWWHNWSHDLAFEHVERESGFGPGIFVSYTFTVIWIADALWRVLSSRSYDARPKWISRSLHVFVTFVVFNGTVVYETGFIRWAGVAGFGILAVLAIRRILSKRC